MVWGRGGRSGPIPHRAAIDHIGVRRALGIATLWCGTATRGADDPIRLSEAAERGTFNVGAARASVGARAGPRGGGDS